MKYSIYSIRNIVNNKRYIGLTCNIKYRWYHHLYSLRNCIHHSIKLQRAYDKYGEPSFEFSIIETLDCDFDYIASEEIKFIKKYDSCDNGYNMTYGGDGTDKRLISDETREKLREASLGNSYALGKKHSEETKRRQSESMKACSDMELRKLRASNVLTRLWATEAFKDKMKSLNTGNTYNLGKHLSEETKLKLSKLHSGANNSFFGKTHSEDNKKLFSDLSRKRWSDESYANKVKESLHKVMSSDEYKNKQSALSSGRSKKTTELDALTIRYRYLCGESPSSISLCYPKLSLSGLKKICYNCSWKHLPNTKDELYNMLINYQSHDKSCEGLETR